MKNDCFAINGDKCKILLDTAFAEYKKAGNCGSDDCPFYKPKGKEKTEHPYGVLCNHATVGGYGDVFDFMHYCSYGEKKTDD